jgi:hypothetical protein
MEEKTVGLCVRYSVVLVVWRIQTLETDYNVPEVYIHKINSDRSNVTCES